MNSMGKSYRVLTFFVVLALLCTSWFSFAPKAQASSSPIRYLAGFQTNALTANDDGSTDTVPIGFTVNFFDHLHDTLYVNNNGNITFDYPQSTYTPYDLTSTTREIVAAFFGDVDTRGSGSSLVTYGNDFVDGRTAFGVNYVNVGYYDYNTDKLNSFQLILIDRSDIGPGDFDIEFNYEKIQWETGDASGGTSGLGGNSARVGFSNGTGEAGTFFELPGSAVNGSFLDTNLVTGLIYNSFNNGVSGRYRFEARNGAISINHNPLIFIPGVAGTELLNDPNRDGIYDEVWPNTNRLVLDPFDNFLSVLALNSSGTGPFNPNDTGYSTVAVGDILRTETVAGFLDMDVYTSTIDFFTKQRSYQEGVDFFVCPYDWRKHVPYIAYGPLLDNTLDQCINDALAANPGKTQVDILAHSMGGLVARYYVSDSAHASRVDHLVTLGTPYLGAPKIALNVVDKTCFIEEYNVCFSNPDILRTITQNFPSVYDIAPGPDFFQVYAGGYIYRNWDKNGDGSSDGWLDMDSSYSLLGERNSGLASQARSYYDSVGGWANGGTNGVNVLMVVGSGLPSPMILWEDQVSDWWNPFGKRIVYSVGTISGDGTVPLNSANMRNPNLGVDLSAGIPTVYFKLNHGELAKNTQVLQVVATFFESDQDLARISNLVGSSMPHADAPSLDPIPLNGQYLTFKGAVKLEVYDEYGNRIGMLDEGGAYEVNIPGASFIPLSQSVSVFLPNDRSYQVFVDGQAQTEGLMTVQDIADDYVFQTTVYEPVWMGKDSEASLYIDPNTTAESILLDQDGDGSTDSLVGVNAVLDGDQSQDRTAPQVSIDIQGTPSGDWYEGWVVVTITAADDPAGLGLDQVEYSFDRGGVVSQYMGPFMVDAEAHRQITARAIDLAGNSAWDTAVGSTFNDVPKEYWSWSWVERLAAAGVTGGCSTNTPMYCPNVPVTRAQMAVFLERSLQGPAFTPPSATGMVFSDVPTDFWSAAWIEQLAQDGITGGCGNGKYCPGTVVTRAQMAVFLLRAIHGASFTPPEPTGIFADVSTDYWAAPWIEQLAAEGITGGCGNGNFCPDVAVTRAQMAVFLVTAFHLP